MVYIIIPNYNGVRLLEICIRSLFGQSFMNFEIFVVDNSSSDNSVYFIRQTFPQVNIIDLDKNYGFSKAVNIGISAALKDNYCTHILLLNNDIECDERFLDEMLKGFEKPDIGSVASKMLNYFNRKVIDDTGNFIKKRGFPIMRGHDEQDKGQYDKKDYVFGPCAGAAIYKREVFENVGLFDEEYFAYLEDVDFSFRMQFYGYKCMYRPQAVCYHMRGATANSFKGRQIYLLERNLVLLRVKNYPVSVHLKYFLYYHLSRIYRNINYLLKSPSYFLYSVWGYLSSFVFVPSFINKRIILYRSKKVDMGYILKLLK